MIQLAQPTDTGEVLRRARPWPAVGAIIELYWRMQQENPRLPHRFYLVGENGVLRMGGSRANLCGSVDDPAEMADFLRFERVAQITSIGFLPPGWRLVEEDEVLLRRPAPYTATWPEGLDEAPRIGEVMQVLESTEGYMTPMAARGFFYADANARRNHGGAEIWGMRRQGQLVATAGAWAIAAREAYIACVETLPQYRGEGMAGGMLGGLCERLGGRLALSLLCLPALCPFYARWGFEPTGQRGIIGVDPGLLL